MKRLQLPTLLAAIALSGIHLHAQAPAPAAPAAPNTAPAATTPPAAGTAAPGTAGAPGAKAKPYASGDVQKIKEFAEALQFHLKMGETARWRGKNDKELADLGTRINKEAGTYYTPLVNLAQAHQVQPKDIPSAISTSDKAAIDKLGKAKEDKWKLEYLELFSKEAKKNARSVDAAAKTFTDPELKDLATRGAKMLDDQAETLEKMYKDLKNPKKEVKK